MLIGAVARDTAAAVAASAAATMRDEGSENEFVNPAYFCAVVLSDPIPECVDEVHKFLAFAVIDALINELDTIEDMAGWLQDAVKSDTFFSADVAERIKSPVEVMFSAIVPYVGESGAVDVFERYVALVRTGTFRKDFKDAAFFKKGSIF